MKKLQIEFFVGLFLLIGIACLAYLSIKLARKEFFGSEGYEIEAVFSNCGSLKTGATINIAGVEVGRVKSITLDDYEAKVIMLMSPGVKIPEDSVASIKTKGLIGEKFIEICPGTPEEFIEDGGLLFSTEPAMDLEGLVSKFVHGKL